jgi:serine/threonine protein kinase
MTPDRWKQVSQVYEAARVRPVDARAAFLAEACGSDEALRREVQALLEQPTSPPFLEGLTPSAISQAMRDATGADMTGRQFGVYLVRERIGVGGMGEVYRARDTSLGRDVAIKVLPPIFTSDSERLARFEHEARVLATINHPNIATIHGIERADGVHALVLELVEGDTLDERLQYVASGFSRTSPHRGPGLPLADALAIARQIAEALEAAHEKGIIHRDLKPANIKIRPDGVVKVLDFGLAKAIAGDVPGADVSHSPTISIGRTGDGVLLGTAAYMSPEQAQGKPVDRRADIWAFGVVLFEMVSGRRGFTGDTTVEVLSNVLKTEPDWTALPPATPTALRSLLRRCLQKDPTRRLRDVADARFEIEEAVNAPQDLPFIPQSAPRTGERWGWVAAVLVVAAAVGASGWFVGRSTRGESELRLEITTPPTSDPTSLAISPDGRRVVFVATSDGKPQLWVRVLDAVSARPLAGTEGSTLPFWSPDSGSVGFYANGQLKRVDVDDGTVRTLLTDPQGGIRGGAWNRNGTILFAEMDAPLSEISAEGGERMPVTETTAQMPTMWFPQFMPDDRHFLFYVTGPAAGIYVGQLGSRDAPRRIIGGVQFATYAPASGHLLFVRDGTLFAQAFDPERLELSGSPVTLADRIVIHESGAALSASATGPIVYRTVGANVPRELVWFDRSGKEIERVAGSAVTARGDVSLFGDGRRVAYPQIARGQTTADIWLLDLNRGVSSRLTSDPDYDIFPVWSPDGQRIAFSSRRNGTWDLYLKTTNGTGNDELLVGTDRYEVSQGDWSPDGRFILYGIQATSSFDVHAVRPDGDRRPFAVVETPAEEGLARFSPDGRWISYESNESGRTEIQVQQFPVPKGKTQVSRDGGTQGLWRGDGKELFYLAPGNQLMAVPIELDSARGVADVGTAKPLFTLRLPPTLGGWQYAVSRDGQRFLVDALPEVTVPISVILNWQPKP